MAESKVWIFVNGLLPENGGLKALIHPGDWLVAVDGGYRHLKALGLRPELVIGDLDSLSEAELLEIQEAKIPIQRFPREKDEVDLELAINAALDRGRQPVRIAGAMGGRLDQLVGNLALLLRPDLSGLNVRLEDGETEAWIIRQESTVSGRPGDLVSLLPAGGAVYGVTTEGLQYPLRAETLFPYRTRGISNVMLGTEAWVKITDGALLCIHIRGQGR
jgi:thiamine pyrophosphokinase